jgi:hypothetical protein
MEPIGTNSWIQQARSVPGVQRVRRKPGSDSPADAMQDFPLPPVSSFGLRGIEQTQDLDDLDYKGQIINCYL